MRKVGDSRTFSEERAVKIQIVNKGKTNVKPIAMCPYLVDIPPEGGKKA